MTLKFIVTVAASVSLFLAGCNLHKVTPAKSSVRLQSPDNTNDFFSRIANASGEDYVTAEKVLLSDPELHKILILHEQDPDPISQLVVRVLVKSAGQDTERYQRVVEYLDTVPKTASRNRNPYSHLESVGPVLWSREGTNLCGFLSLRLVKKALYHYKIELSVISYLSRCKSPEATSALLRYSIEIETEMQSMLAKDENLRLFFQAKEDHREAAPAVIEAIRPLQTPGLYQILQTRRDYALKTAAEIEDKNYSSKLTFELQRAKNKNLAVPKQLDKGDGR